ncbi:MAG: HYR domain-containing protein [candidate division Zixibacteria bacterium]|nr:HYR domain-containing protein [candidate division Zixibacteria bacterium]
MMRRTWLTLGLLCLVILTFGQANAAVLGVAKSPQATDGAITMADADSFHVDIWLDVETGDPDLCGGKMGFEFYSPDGSITNFTHLTVPTGDAFVSTQSVEYLNGFSTMFNLLVWPTENGWGNGTLPDSIAFDLAGMTCMTPAHANQEYLRFNLRVTEDGVLCIRNPQIGEFDWAFTEPHVFEEQCWTIGDYVVDNPPEITSCPADVEIDCGSPYDPSVTGTATATDDNDTPTITFSDATPVPGTCPTIMTITRTWTAEDSKAQTATCDQIITIVDNTAPVFTSCPANITIECGTSTDPSVTGLAYATDACDDTPDITYLDNQVGDVITRTWTAADECGNSDDCIQTITFEDTTDPTVTCPTDILVANEPGTCEATVAFDLPTADDNCDVSVDVVADPAPGLFNVGTTPVTITATDDAGNIATCTFDVTVEDTEDPIITCPADIALTCGDSDQPEFTGYPTGSDNCDDVLEFSFVDATPEAGIMTRTWTATDDAGNTATCDQAITLAIDEEPPTFDVACPVDVTVECHQIPAPAEMTATDNCAGLTINYDEVKTDGDCANTYTLTRTWTAEDGSGNTAECVQVITVEDTTTPVLTSCPEEITLTCGMTSEPANTGTPVATDNCADPIYTYSDGEMLEGTFTRTWTIADACDNSITCDQIIHIVDDEIAPVFDQECPIDVTVDCDAVPTAAVLTATDNCDASTEVIFDEVRSNDVCDYTYTLTRTWTVTDSYTNSTSCVQVITVEDTQGPAFTNCPADVTVAYGDPYDIGTLGNATIEDNCDASPTLDMVESEMTGDEVAGYEFTRTWTAYDICDNESQCIQVITLEGMGDPFLIADPASFDFDAKEFDIIEDERFDIFEKYGRQVQILDAISSEPWLIVNTNFPLSTPNVIFFDIDLSEVLYGDYTAIISVYSTEAQNSPLEVPVNIHVAPFIAPPDSVWVATVPAVPGGKAEVSVYFKNNDPLTRVNVPMEWTPDYLEFDSVSFVGSRVEYISDFEKGYTFSNVTNQVQIAVDPTFSPYIPGGRGLLAKLYFTVDGSVATPAFSALNSAFIAPDGYVYFEDETGEEDIPIYTSGGVVIDDQTAFVCGSVVEIIDGVKVPVEGAMVELWDSFPVGALQASELSDVNGQFACGTLGIVPFDAYAYKDGYYPGMVSEIDFGTLGIEILLSKVPEVVMSSSWAAYFSGEYYGGTCMSYFYNIPLPVGAVVDAYTNEQPAVHCGTHFVDMAGEYLMYVYADNPQTPEKDGAVEGDEIKFFINGYATSTDAPVYWTETTELTEICFDLFRVETRTIELNVGKNLISWNLDTPSDDIELLFADVMDNVTAILGFESGGYTYDPMYPEFSNLFFADHIHGYWVDMANPDILTIEGSPVAPTTPIALESEWNLVSYLPDVAYEPAVALAGVHSDLDVALGWIGDASLSYEAAYPEYATLEMMETGYGYWLYMLSSATLSYPGVGPTTIFGQGPAKFNVANIENEIKTSRFWTSIYSSDLRLDGIPVPHGAEILALASNDRVVGSGTVGQDGRFGFMPVYGDDPMTAEIDGLQDGEKFSLVIDGVRTDERFSRINDSHRMEISDVTSAKSGDRLLPDQFGLAQNYPNPFNPSTSISFAIPTATTVTLEIFNILGEKVATPFSGMATAGVNQIIWDGKNESGSSVASGIYFYRMTANDFEKTCKMVLMK